MAWRIEFERAAARELEKLDQKSKERTLLFLRDRIAPLENPRSIGQALKGERFGEFWRYRIGDYRVVGRIEDVETRIVMLRVGHRREIYR
jgi:mRNA interferase RelE/StbE